jgi:hypothetical protein
VAPPRHNDRLTDTDALHAASHCENLRDALVANRERAPERHASADAADDRVDGPYRDTGLHQARHRAVDRNGVAVTACSDEGPHDRIARISQDRRVAIAPRKTAATDERELTHVVILPGSASAWPAACRRLGVGGREDLAAAPAKE